MSLFQVFHQGNFVLIAVFLLLILMSFVSWYLIFWKFFFLRKQFSALNLFNKTHGEVKNWPQKNLFDQKNSEQELVHELISEVKDLETTLSQYSHHEAKKEILTTHLTQAIDRSRYKLEQGLTILASIGSSAPFIGLFGTVIGIYDALQSISAQGNAGISVVAGPIAEALIATAVGLFAAIPAVLAYNAFVRMNKIFIQNLRHLAEQITVYLSNQSSRN